MMQLTKWAIAHKPFAMINWLIFKEFLSLKLALQPSGTDVILLHPNIIDIIKQFPSCFEISQNEVRYSSY